MFIVIGTQVTRIYSEARRFRVPANLSKKQRGSAAIKR
jgi:hypothetical protein